MNFDKEMLRNIGLLVLRACAGGMLLVHGYGKLAGLINGQGDVFPDPLGIGHTFSNVLAVGAEFFCALFVIAGAFTRIATLPILFTMFVAIFFVHGLSTFTGGYELALCYLVMFASVLLCGAGRFSVDGMLRMKK